MSMTSSTLEAGKLNTYFSASIAAKCTHLTWRKENIFNQLTFKKFLNDSVELPIPGPITIVLQLINLSQAQYHFSPKEQKNCYRLKQIKNESLKYFPWHPTATESTLVVAYICSSCHVRQISPKICLNQIFCAES